MRQIDVLDLKEVKKKSEIKVDAVKPELKDITLSIEECRALTLENNLDLRVQLINPAIAEEGVNQEEAKFEAIYSGKIEYNNTDMPQASLLDGTGINQHIADIGVDIPLRTGGSLRFNIIDSRKKESSVWSLLNPSYYSSPRISISQPLLRNAGKNVNTYRIRMAQYNSQIVDTRTKLQAIRIIANIDIAYWKLYATRKLLEIRKQQYDLSKALFEQTKRFVELGLKSKVEVIRTEASMAEKLEAIIRAENDVRDTERLLKRMMNKENLGMRSKTIIIPSTSPEPVRYEFDNDLMVEKSIENRMELLELELQLAQDSSTIDYLKNQKLPLVTMQYNYNINALGGDRHELYDMLLDNDYNDHKFSLQFSIPLFNEGAESNYRRAIYERTQRLATKESKEAEIENEVLNQIDKLEANWQRIQATRQTTILTDQQYKTEKKQYELGFASSTDVLDAQTKLAEAQIMEIVAIAEYQIALVDLAYATGTLLGAAKVELEPIVPEE
ncbi:MAG: TolC family protein [Deltaproteobacteria bacterium]|nr:TolC family protein [Deltaproteobacteria bacterium]